MLNLLPVYLDHIFSPTLRDSGFTTEVFNVNGEGHEGGVVYSEMQGRQGSSDDELELRIQQVLYDNRNGYRTETGGMLDALRHLKLADSELSAQTSALSPQADRSLSVQEYHSRLYVPQNVTVCVFGQAVHPLRLLKTLIDEVEPRLAAAGLANGVRPRGWKRPFVETSTAQNPPRLFKNEIEVVKFAEKDESTGEVRLHWIGPRAGDFLTEAAIDVLGDYLSGNSVSPLNEEFVENKDPWASGQSQPLSLPLSTPSLTTLFTCRHLVHFHLCQSFPPQLHRLLRARQKVAHCRSGRPQVAREVAAQALRPRSHEDYTAPVETRYAVGGGERGGHVASS